MFPCKLEVYSFTTSFSFWGEDFFLVLQFNSDSSWPHESQHARPSCPSLTPEVYSHWRPSSPWCHPAISSSCWSLLLPPVPPSIRVFSSELILCMWWPKHWSFTFSISPSNEYLGLTCFQMDWLDLLVVQRTLKSLLQHHSSKSINFSALSFLHSPTLTSIHDHWKNHSLDQTDLCWQSNVSAF